MLGADFCNEQREDLRESQDGLNFSGLADEDAGGEDQTATDDYLKAGESEAGLEVAVANEGDDDQLDAHHDIGKRESTVDVGNQERQHRKPR